MNQNDPPTAESRTLAVWVASGLGVGLVMPAPGTFGALWGIGLVWLFALLPHAIGWWAATLAIIAAGVPLCWRAARDLQLKDPAPVVWDELATVPLVFGFVEPAWPWIVGLGFLLHRVFDITKPWPCQRLESLPGGWGIMIDDVVASLYAAGVLWVVNQALGQSMPM